MRARLRRGLLTPVATLGGGGFSAEAQQFFDRVSDPGATRKAHYATMIDALVAAGVWAKLDVFYVFAAADAATALTNLKSSSYGATAVNSPGFTADRGYVSDGSTSYINTNYNPATAGGNYTLDDAHVSGWNCTSDTADALAQLLGSSTVADEIGIIPKFSGNVFVRANDGSTGIANANRQGHYIGSRTNSTTLEAYKNGVSIGEPGSDTSTSIPSRNVFALARNGGGTPDRLNTDETASISLGGGLSDAQALAFYGALNTYMVAVGAA